MAPADIRKEGSSYDLTIAIGVMAAGELIAADLLEDSVIMGELSLDGSILPIKGALPIAIQAQKDGYKRLIVKEEITKKDGMVPINVSSYRNGTYVFKLYIDDKLTHNSNFVVTR
jgi:magnesium chelatase family protein